MLRLLARMLGYLLVAFGFVTLVIDGTSMIANSDFEYTTLGEVLSQFLGARHAGLQAAVERSIHPLLWDPVLVHVMQVPAAIAGLGIGFLLLRLGTRQEPGIGVVTRR